MLLSGQREFEFNIIFRGVRGSYPVPGEATKIFGGNTACIEVNAGGRKLLLDAGTGICSVDPTTLSGKVDSHNSAAEQGSGERDGRGEGKAEVNDEGKAQAEGKRVYDIFLSHTHWDHIQGFPFFQPAYNSRNSINIYGFRGIEQIMQKQMGEPCFPVKLQEMGAELHFFEIDDKTTIRLKPTRQGEGEIDGWGEVRGETEGEAGGRTEGEAGGRTEGEAGGRTEGEDEVLIRSYPTTHSPQSLCYRIAYRGKSCTYLGDYEHPPENSKESSLVRGLTEFMQDSDILIYDAHFTDREYHGREGFSSHRGWGHSTWQEGVKLARKTGAGKLVLIHHAPFRTDEELFQIEAKAGELFPHVLAAREGMEIIL